jgi:hypothetical protein
MVFYDYEWLQKIRQLKILMMNIRYQTSPFFQSFSFKFLVEKHETIKQGTTILWLKTP